jgi:putative acetyltransferase
VLEVIHVVPGDVDGVEIARGLFREYEKELGEDLCFQSFEEELASLPGKYSPPDGALLLGMVGEQVAGCVALRPLEKDICEMKRLYVRPVYRGSSFGRELAEEVVSIAREMGYEAMRLDTLARMVPAIMLYRSLGFEDIEPYYDNPIEGAVYLEKRL